MKQNPGDATSLRVRLFHKFR